MSSIVTLGIGSGIAAYKTIDLATRLISSGYDVQAIMSSNAGRMVSPEEFAKKTGITPYVDMYGEAFDYREVITERRVEHIDVADRSNLLVIAPATANLVAKLAHGIADDYLTTVALAVTCPILVCPSMNVNMWRNPAVMDNILTLRSRGILVMEPDIGPLACGYEGPGRLPSPDRISEEIDALVNRGTSLASHTVLVTAGGTVEPVDGVRVIANRSSGKMGVALAEAAYLRGAHVILLQSDTSPPPRYPMDIKFFSTTDSLETLVETEAPGADIIIHAAAMADFSPVPATGKLDSGAEMVLHLKPRTKLLDRLKSHNPNAIIVGFKAAYGSTGDELVALAQQRRERAGVDMIVANDVSREDRGFGADDNAVTVVTRDAKPIHIPLSPKTVVAGQVLDIIARKIDSDRSRRRK
jgi:phosphopantothenoylcysteine decarboxylase/phosphopantothenate--cysteine ligase